MHRLFQTIAVLVATSSSGCILNANSAARVAAGRTHVPVEGNVSSLSAADLAAAVRALGTWPVYRLYVTDHDHVSADMQPIDGQSFQGDISFIERVNGKWEAHELIIHP